MEETFPMRPMHKIRKIGFVCSAKPVLTEDLCVEHKQGFSITRYMCDTYT
jgi:hypothetical protein